jgi:hypothetical protein
MEISSRQDVCICVCVNCLFFGMEVKAVRGNEIDLATKFNNVLKNKATY